MSSDDRVVICSGDECRLIKKGDPIPAGWHINEEGSSTASQSSQSSVSDSASSTSSFQFSSLFGPSLLRKKVGNTAASPRAAPSSSSSSSGSSSWSCLKCGYDNPPSAEKCGMCEQPIKPEAAAAEYEIVSTDSHLTGKYVGIYFSAHWCPPCRQFTPMLSKFYSANAASKNLEIVFVSSDKNATAFDEYFKEMAPWAALPFTNRDLKSKLSVKFKVEGIPTFAILHPNGEIATKNGRDAVANDAQAKEFPWAQKSFWQIMGENGGMLQDAGSKSISAEQLRKANEMIAVYFGTKAHRPCVEYEEALLALYDTLKKEKKAFEVIFVSADKTSEQFQEHLKRLPFPALPFEDSRMKSLFLSYEIDGAPSLLLFDSKSGECINNDALSIVEAAEEFPWKPLPLENLQLHKCRRPILLSFIRGPNAAKEHQTLQVVAESFSSRWSASGHDYETHPVRFLLGKAGQQATEIVSELMGLDLSEGAKSQFGILILPAGVWLSWHEEGFNEEHVRKLVTAFETEQRQGVIVHRLKNPGHGHGHGGDDDEEHEHGENCAHGHGHGGDEEDEEEDEEAEEDAQHASDQY